MSKPTNPTLDKIGWVALFAGLITLVARRFVPVTTANMQTWIERLTTAGIIVAVIGFLLLVVANWGSIRAMAGTRQAKYGANSVVLTVAVIGIIGLVNYLGSRYHYRFDLTEAKTFTISDQTKRILGTLDGEVKVTAFYQDNNPTKAQVKDLLDSYQYVSKHLKVTFVDPEKSPASAIQMGVDRSGVTVFEKGGRSEKVTSFSEQDFTSALIKLVKRKETKVYFVEGHGELSLEEFGDRGISKIKETLGKDHYQTEALALAAKQQVPSDAEVVIIAGPKHAYMPKEVAALEGYLNKGGKLLVMADAGVDTGLNPVLAKYGISLGNDLVLDPVANAWRNMATPLITRYRWHEITKSMSGIQTIFPNSRSVSLAANQPAGQMGSVLAETTPAGWGETALKDPNVSLGPNDTKGPVPLAAAVSKDAPEAPKPKDGEKPAQTRLVVFGCSSFMMNGVLGQNPMNADLALNSVNWLAQEESLIAIRPKPPQSKQITLSGEAQNTIFLSSLLGVPGLVLALGIFVWYRRR